MTRQFRWYLGGHAAWFTSLGMQMIVFPWLVAVVLKEPAQRVGLAQMAVMAPSMLFMLYGGAVADRGRREGGDVAYVLHPATPMSRDVRRVARNRLDDAMETLDKLGKGDGTGTEEAVHDVRKRCKEVRALARLARVPLVDQFDRFNATVRDAADVLAPIRDAQAVLATLDDLRAVANGGAADLDRAH